MMKKRIATGIICTAALGMSLMLSGCTNGIDDTIDLVKNAEAAKQSVEQMVNMENGQQTSVGTVADPNYQPVNRLNLVEFNISCSGSQYSANWIVDTNFENVRVQIFADTDNTGEDGTKIASFDSISTAAEKEFRYEGLEEGSYYCYIKVTGTDGSQVTMYSEQPITTSIENPEGALDGIVIETDGNSVLMSWTAADFERYHAILVSPDDTNQILAETTVVEAQAKLDIPEGYTVVYAAVASYEDGVMGPYRLYKVEVSTDPVTTESPAVDNSEAGGVESE